MAVKCLFQRDEIRDAIRNTLDVRRRAFDVRIMTMNLGDFNLKKDSDPFLRKINLLVNAGVTVTILIGGREKRFSDEERRFLKELSERGVNIFYDYRAHAKLILVNSNQEKLALITSANFTHTALYVNWEIGVVYFNIREDIYKMFDEYINEKLDMATPIDDLLEAWGMKNELV